MFEATMSVGGWAIFLSGIFVGAWVGFLLASLLLLRLFIRWINGNEERLTEIRNSVQQVELQIAQIADKTVKTAKRQSMWDNS